MKDEDFEQTMDEWASREEKSAPQMHPTEEMYRMIEARKRRSLLAIHARRVLVGMAAACLILSVVVLPAIRYLYTDREPSIGLRAVTVPKGEIVVKNPPSRGKGGPKKGAMPFNQLMFQYQKAIEPSIYGVDLRFPHEEKTSLSAGDSYRLVIQPANDRYVYVYQLDASGKLMKHFPNNAYSSMQNPLKQGQYYEIPSAPNWFCLGKGEGEESIYVAASGKPIPELENLYVQYNSAESELEKQGTLSLLIKQMEVVETSPDEDAAKWIFTFQHQK